LYTLVQFERRYKMNGRKLSFLVVAIFLAMAGSVNANENTNTFKLVDTATVAIVNVSGWYSENGYNGVKYPADGLLKVTLSPVSTNDVWENYGYTYAVWENWNPLVVGDLIVHKPEGDVKIHMNFKTGFPQLRQRTGYTHMEFFTYGIHETASDFTEATMDLFGAGNGLVDGGNARLNLWTQVDAQARLSGNYILASPGDQGDLDFNADNPYIKLPKEKGEIYKMVDEGMNIKFTINGRYYERGTSTGHHGSWPNYPAEGEFSVTLRPKATDDVKHDVYGSCERISAFFEDANPTISGTITAEKPEGDVKFHVSWRDTVTSGMDAYRCGKGDWRVNGDFWFGPGVHEGGKNKPDFYWGDFGLRSYSDEPKYGSEGEVGMNLEGANYWFSTYPRAEYTAVKTEDNKPHGNKPKGNN
jgi:hypothetical protein